MSERELKERIADILKDYAIHARGHRSGRHFPGDEAALKGAGRIMEMLPSRAPAGESVELWAEEWPTAGEDGRSFACDTRRGCVGETSISKPRRAVLTFIDSP